MYIVLYLVFIGVCVSQPLVNNEVTVPGPKGDNSYLACIDTNQQLLQVLRTENRNLQTQMAVYDSKLQHLNQQVGYTEEALQDLRYRYEQLQTFIRDTVIPKLSDTLPYQPEGQGSKEQNKEQSQNVGFYAIVSSDTETNPVVFDKVYLNEGGCYDNTTGVFTCSVSGVYQITWSVETFGEEDVGTILDVNGEEFGYTWTDSQDQQYDTSTNVAILRLHTGDAIKVILQAGSKVDARQSSFTGHFLFT